MITIKADVKGLQRVISKYPKQLDNATSIALRRMGQEVRSDAVSWAPVKTGDLSRSILMSPQFPKTRVTVGTNKPDARIQDLGGTIRPKRAQYLTIPLGGTRGSIRSHTGGFFIKSKRGNLLYVKKAGKGIKPLFVLKKDVTLKGKPYLTRAFKKMTMGRASKILSEEVNFVIKSTR